MTPNASQSSDGYSLSVRAEAAAWIARLHATDRTAADEDSFRRWLAANPAHAVAFERMTELWEAGTRLQSDTLARLTAQSHSGTSRSVGRNIWAAAALVLLTAIGAFYYFNQGAVTTRVGEQRTLTLEDGTRITLNTATRLKLEYSDRQRHISMERGEALFEVAKRSQWPFVVTAGGREIRALGTAFVVRRDERSLSVTLVDGKVGVSSVEPQSASVPAAETEILMPGQRVMFAENRPPRRDQPSLDQITAWRQGVIALDRTPLAEAIAEMNRYSTTRLVMAQLDATDIRVSGVFRAGDSVEFARALARTHGLQVLEEAHRIVLMDRPIAERADAIPSGQ